MKVRGSGGLSGPETSGADHRWPDNQPPVRQGPCRRSWDTEVEKTAAYADRRNAKQELSKDRTRSVYGDSSGLRVME